MKKVLINLLLLWPLLVLAAYEPAGSDSTVDVMTWNIEWFAKNDQSTINEVATIISDLKVDLVAVEEIADIGEFNQLVSQLDGWSGQLSPHTYYDGSYQKVGLLYNSSKVTVQSWQLLFENDSYSFPRPPMEFTLQVQEGAHSFDLKLIVVHLKAYGDEDSEARRRSAINSLKSYIDGQLSLGGEQDFILLGDFNDHLEDPAQDNVFSAMLNDTATYSFVDQPLVGNQGSYIGYNEPNLIDHICITRDARAEFGVAGSCQVLYLDQQNSSFESLVSDHRPMLARFAFDAQSAAVYTPLADIQSGFGSYLGQTVTVKGIVTVGSGTFSSSYTSVYIQDASGAGINIYNPNQLIADFQSGTEIEVSGVVADYNGLHEIQYNSHSVLAQNQPLPQVTPITTNQITQTEFLAGCLAEIRGRIESISSGPHINMMVNDGSGSGKVYFDPDAGLDVSELVVGDSVRISGVKTVYSNEGQLQPSQASDFEKLLPSAVSGGVAVPLQTTLFANYPNPFNPQTVISWQQEVAGRIILDVLNIRGQMINRLTHANWPAGKHRILFNGVGLPGGVYLVRLRSRSGIQTRKMLLVK